MSNINAQFSVGVKFGANWSSVTSYDIPKGYKEALNRDNVFGACADYSLNNNLSFQTEFIYTGKGIAQTDGENLQKFNMNYLELPLLAKYTFGKKALRTYVIAGPYFAYWLTGFTEWKDNQNMTEQSYSFADVFLLMTKQFDYITGLIWGLILVQA